MDRNEFDALRNLRGKAIDGDVKFRADSRGSQVMRVKRIEVQNAIGWPVSIDAHYDPRFPKFVLNFSIDGIGPICRVCVNGTEHKDVGRFHKHELREESDPA